MNQVYRAPDSEQHYRKGTDGELILDTVLTQNAIRRAAASMPLSGGARVASDFHEAESEDVEDAPITSRRSPTTQPRASKA